MQFAARPQGVNPEPPPPSVAVHGFQPPGETHTLTVESADEMISLFHISGCMSMLTPRAATLASKTCSPKSTCAANTTSSAVWASHSSIGSFGEITQRMRRGGGTILSLPQLQPQAEHRLKMLVARD